MISIFFVCTNSDCKVVGVTHVSIRVPVEHLFWSSVDCWSESYHISVSIKHSVVHLHEHVTCNEQVVKALLANIEHSNCRLAPSLLLVDAHITFHPMVGWNVVVDTIDRECEVAVMVLVAFQASLTSPITEVTLEPSESPRRHRD